MFPSPEEQFNTAIASYSNSSNNGLGSPLFSWGGSGSKLNDPSPSGLMGPPPPPSSGLAGATPSPGFVSGELKEWTPQLEQGQQLLDRRVTGSAFKTHSPLTALADETPPMSGVKEQRRDADEQLDEPIRSMRSLEESPSGRQGEKADAVLVNVGAELFDGGQSGGSDD